MGVACSARTVRAEMALHSLHCYFLLAGKQDTPIIYKTSRLRDGGSYCTRQVEARQMGRCIFVMLLSYQVPEPRQPHFAIPLPEPLDAGGSGGEGAGGSSRDGEGSNTNTTSGATPTQPTPSSLPSSQILPLSHMFTRSPTPNSIVAAVPAPEDCPLNEQRYIDLLHRRADAIHPKIQSVLRSVIRDRQRSPVEIRDALPGMYDVETSLPTSGYEQAFWLRSREAVSGGLEVQKAALAYASDFQFLSTVPKALGNSTRIKMMASLDHAMWFYAEFDVNQWLLFVMQTQAASHGRGVVLGRIYRRDGTLVAVAVSTAGVSRENPRCEYILLTFLISHHFPATGTRRNGAREPGQGT